MRCGDRICHQTAPSCDEEVSLAKICRRAVLAGLFANCAFGPSAQASFLIGARQQREGGDPKFAPRDIYAQVRDGDFVVPKVNYIKLNPRFLRQRVDPPRQAPPGTILVSVTEHHLYFVNEDGSAIRYGVGVGKQGYLWKGVGRIARVAAWPRWTPTSDMRARLPELESHKDGVEGGLQNPLGARALYIYQNGHDTLYRVHGTPEWWSVGRSVSSGCIRMLQQDVIDLSKRAVTGASIIVY